MSFVRPELAAALRRLREAILAGLMLAAGLLLVWRGYGRVAPLAFVAGMALAVAGLGLLVGAVRRLQLRAAPAAGVVQIDEGRIGYFGPLGGAFVDRDLLIRVEILHRAGQPMWRLRTEDGAVTEIPLGAMGAGTLPDAFAALAGFDAEAAVAALSRARRGPVTVWRRSA